MDITEHAIQERINALAPDEVIPQEHKFPCGNKVGFVRILSCNELFKLASLVKTIYTKFIHLVPIIQEFAKKFDMENPKISLVAGLPIEIAELLMDYLAEIWSPDSDPISKLNRFDIGKIRPTVMAQNIRYLYILNRAELEVMATNFTRTADVEGMVSKLFSEITRIASLSFAPQNSSPPNMEDLEGLMKSLENIPLGE